MTLYAFTRCAALYNTASALFEKKDAGEVSMQHEAMAKHMMAGAMMWAKQNEIELTMDELSANMEGIQAAYVDRWDVNVAETGHNFGELTKQDYLLCKTIYESVNQ